MSAAQGKEASASPASPTPSPTPSANTNDGKKKEKAKGATKFVSARDYKNPTPHGQLKDFSVAMADAYQPQAVEAAWDTWWETMGLYKPDPNPPEGTQNFVMVIPPPNVTGTLHLGHALTCSIEDAITRWNRMSGKNTLWVPGTDHAGIATQVVVEKRLMKEKGITRHHLGREAFVNEVWKWKETNGNTINSQIRRLGASVDWEHERFTMDAMLSVAVKEAFIRLHKQGLIYRSNRLVNWSCSLRTAISSIEVEYQELEKSTLLKVPGYEKPVEFGVIHSFAYKVSDAEGKPTDEEIVVATTRIETMLGDVAVAVHPDDARYKHLHGKRLIHPFVPTRYLTVVCDPVLVDMAFGTGCVKVTPAHDPNDFACGERLKLDFVNIFTDDGYINENGGKFAKQKRFHARTEIIEELTKLGLYRGKKDNKMSLGICSRSKDVVEPVLRPQWWVRCKSMAERSVAAVRSGKLQIIPGFHDRIWYHWLENIQDWCISRQLWWGHRIPAYFVTVEGRPKLNDGDDQAWVVAENENDAKKIAGERFGVDPSKIKLDQDPDVLDTWFSSGLFPFSVFGWPNQTPDLARYFPGTLLETGHDILFFWVARMVMMSLALTDQLPFRKIYLHAMVRDKFGRKMSKSLGNVIDPLDVIYGITLEELHAKLLSGNLDAAEVQRAQEGQTRDFPNGIAECGADALRFGLLAYLSQGQDLNLDIQRVVAYRQFGNKLWQANRFALLNFPTDFKPWTLDEIHSRLTTSGTVGDTWILNRLHATVAAMDAAWDAYEFAEATTAAYNFWLYDFCDHYLELTKPVFNIDANANEAQTKAKQLSLAILYVCLEYGLRLLHPLMPFLTEELYHRLPGAVTDPVQIQENIKKFGKKGSGSIMVQAYPKPNETARFASPQSEESMKVVKDIAASARSIRVDLGLTKQRVDMFIVCSTKELNAIVHTAARDIATLGYANSVRALSANEPHPSRCLSYAVNSQLEIHVPLAGLFDVSALIVKMENDADKINRAINALQEQMKGSAYESKTKDEVKKRNTDKVAADSAELKKTNDFVNRLKATLSPEQLEAYKQFKRTSKEADIAKAKAKLSELQKPYQETPADKIPKKVTAQIAELNAEIELLAQSLANL